MKKAIIFLLLVSFPATAVAGMSPRFEPVERDLIETELEMERQIEESIDVINEKERVRAAADAAKTAVKKPKSSKWYWIIGGAIVAGGIAAASGGSSGGDTGGGGGGDTGTVVGKW